MKLLLRARTAVTLLPALILLSAATSGCDLVTADLKAKESAEWRKTYQLQPGGRVEISNVNGKIDVTPSADNTVEVVATKIATGATPEAAKGALDRIEIREESTTPELIRIETKVARMTGLFHGSSQVQYVVRVPPTAEVRFTTVNGGIELAGLNGRINAETTNGGIRARGVGGPIEASTTNGGVEVELTEVKEPGVKLECTNGGIRLRLPSDAKANVSANISNGGIEVLQGMPLEQLSQESRRRLEARLNGGGPSIRLSGVNGGIHIGPK
jgi:bifunctional DNA-binding transcriptional regulator/antitoxin component of YhaV-PrlF toxin-antitoxin module